MIKKMIKILRWANLFILLSPLAYFVSEMFYDFEFIDPTLKMYVYGFLCLNAVFFFLNVISLEKNNKLPTLFKLNKILAAAFAFTYIWAFSFTYEYPLLIHNEHDISEAKDKVIFQNFSFYGNDNLYWRIIEVEDYGGIRLIKSAQYGHGHKALNEIR